jgi:hypothetical protein
MFRNRKVVNRVMLGLAIVVVLSMVGATLGLTLIGK